MRVLTAATLLALTAPVLAAPPDSTVYADDVSSLDHLVTALYDVISGPAGHERDWDRMRHLFLPEGRLLATGPRPDGTHGHRVMDVDAYIASSGPWMLEHGFFEEEIARRTEQFGATAHVWSTYAGRQTLDAEPFVRGVNSIQALWDGTRWWVVSVFWSPEHPGAPLPEHYLTSSD